MALTLKINGRDLSEFLRVAHGDGLEPASAESVEPQFTGSTAIGEGQSFVGDALGNVAMSFPLILNAADTDAMYQLIREIRSDLVKGNTVEYRSGGASQSTLFDMESGKLEPKFEFWLDQNARCHALLTVWRRPYGHTGTSRVIASVAGTGMITVHATGIMGDAPAQANIRVWTALDAPTQMAGNLGPVSYGVKYPVPSGFNPLFVASQIAADTTTIGTATSKVFAASGRIDNRYVSALQPSSARAVDADDVLDTSAVSVTLPGETFKGRYRVLANVRWDARFGSKRPDMYVKFMPNLGDDLNPTFTGRLCPISNTATSWQLIDLGEVNVRGSGTAIWASCLRFQQPSGGTAAVGTYPLGVDGFRLIPVDGGMAGVRVEVTNQPFAMSASRIQEISGVDQEVSLRAAATSQPVQFGGPALRGDWPNLPPVGSPMASGPAMLVIDPVSYSWHQQPAGNRQAHVTVEVRERFSYLR